MKNYLFASLAILLAVSIPATTTVDGPSKSYVNISEASPYVVPLGKMLIVKSVGFNEHRNLSVHVLIDGVKMTEVLFGQDPTEDQISMVNLPLELVADQGQTVSLTTGGADPDDGRAWCYLFNKIGAL